MLILGPSSRVCPFLSFCSFLLDIEKPLSGHLGVFSSPSWATPAACPPFVPFSSRQTISVILVLCLLLTRTALSFLCSFFQHMTGLSVRRWLILLEDTKGDKAELDACWNQTALKDKLILTHSNKDRMALHNYLSQTIQDMRVNWKTRESKINK